VLLSGVFASLGAIYLLAVAGPLSVIDIREHRLPNKFVLPAFPIIILGFVVASVSQNSWQQTLFALTYSLVGFGIGLLINRYGSLGMGDVKLIAAMTLALAWFDLFAPVLALAAGLLLAAAVILILLVTGRTTLSQSIALGPYLLLGFVVTQILTWSSYFGGFDPYFFR
jgi:leader peptidase (prepilin peptidase)/N-methyltransferase